MITFSIVEIIMFLVDIIYFRWVIMEFESVIMIFIMICYLFIYSEDPHNYKQLGENTNGPAATMFIYNPFRRYEVKI